MKNKKVKNPPSNWIIFDILLRILGFPFFLGISLVGALVMWLRFLVNYTVYGGETIAYYQDSRRKLIHDVFLKVAEEKKDPNPELLEELTLLLKYVESVGNEEGVWPNNEQIKDCHRVIRKATK